MAGQVIERPARGHHVDEPEQRRAQLAVAGRELHRAASSARTDGGRSRETPAASSVPIRRMLPLDRVVGGTADCRGRLPPGLDRVSGRGRDGARGVARSIASQPIRAHARPSSTAPAAAEPEQALGVEELDRDREVDQEADHLQRRAPVDDLVDLQRQQITVAMKVRYSAQRLPSHRPTASVPSSTAYASSAIPTACNVPELSVNSLSSSRTIPTWPDVCDRTAGDAALERGEHLVVVPAQRAHGRREHEHGDPQRPEHQEMERSVDRDQPQHDPIAQRLAARGTDLGALGRILRAPASLGVGSATQLSQRRQRCQRRSSLLAGDDRVLGAAARPRRGRPARGPDAADDQLPVELAPAPRRWMGSGRPLHRLYGTRSRWISPGCLRRAQPPARSSPAPSPPEPSSAISRSRSAASCRWG